MNSEPIPFKTVSVIGLGYIGLPTAATIATRGLNVIGVDVDVRVVTKLNEGRAHFSEPDLDMLLEAAVTTGKLRAVCEPEPADAFIIAVPTPFLDDRSPDLSFVKEAALSVARVLRPGNLLVLESTCPVGATAKMCQWIGEARPDLTPPTESTPGDFSVAYCPERILPGRMLFELVENDRVIGGVNKDCTAHAASLYRLFVRGNLLPTRAPVAELVKLVENAYRDVNIAFANELSVICEEENINVWEVIKLANRHPRVNILNPGPGVGGHCIAVDPWFIISAHRDNARLMSAARQINDEKPQRVINAAKRQIDRFKHPTVACLGLSYKPDVDDLRQSPALKIVDALKSEEIDLIVVEPHIKELPPVLLNQKNITLSTFETALEKSDILILLVGHSAFQNPPRDRLLSRVVIDTVGLWQL